MCGRRRLLPKTYRLDSKLVESIRLTRSGPDVVENEATATDADPTNLDKVLVATPLPAEPSAYKPDSVPSSESFHDDIMAPQAVLDLIANGDFTVDEEVEVESNLLQPQPTVANCNHEVETIFLPPDVNSAQISRSVNPRTAVTTYRLLTYADIVPEKTKLKDKKKRKSHQSRKQKNVKKQD